MSKKNNQLELYIHIPFCVKKCAYCDFLSGPGTEEQIERYVCALLKEINLHKEIGKNAIVTTIFFGGGTPSVLSSEQMKRILEAIHCSFQVERDVEVTIEANPGTVTYEKLVGYKEAGIHRISFGLQSVKEEELRLLGRIHTFPQFLESYHLARKAGFQNINVDLISAIPKQTLESWEETLETVIDLQPEHISAYSLIIEEGTPFAALYKEGAPFENQLPSEEVERAIYKRTANLLSKAGYHRYEISNYAKEGMECRHNLGYWKRTPYLGLGLGASSLMSETRFQNTDDMETYIRRCMNGEFVHEEVERLTIEEQIEEFIFLGLRKMEGISTRTFLDTFQKDIWSIYKENLNRMIDQGLLEVVGDRIRLTEDGIDVSNYVFAEILCL